MQFVYVWLQLGVFGCIRDRTYHLIDRNGWPISPDQENDLHVVDVLQNMCVKIAWLSAMAAACHPAVMEKTLYKTVKLKRSVSVEQYATKRPRSVFYALARLDWLEA